jgi:hypothetical protein
MALASFSCVFFFNSLKPWGTGDSVGQQRSLDGVRQKEKHPEMNRIKTQCGGGGSAGAQISDDQ